MVLFAFSLQDQVEKYGAYVAVACFFGLAVLSLLYFAQARELRRLRDWAGRSPEFAWEELERRVLSLESRRAAPARVAAPVPAAAVATNGAHKLKPEQVAALAFARAAGVAQPPHPPKPAPVPVPQPVAVAAEAAAAEAPPAETPAAVPPPPTPAPETAADPVPATGNGHGSGDVPAPATPAGRREPAAPLRQTPPPRRPAPAPARRMPTGPPARRETSTRSVILICVLGLLVVGGAAFGAKQLLGGDSKTPTKPNVVVPPGTDSQTSGGGGGGSSKQKASAPPRAERTVVVFNGTAQTGLAATMKDQLVTAGYADGNVSAADDPKGRGVTTSVVYYKAGAAAQGRDVARALGIDRGNVKAMDADTQALAPDKSVIVEVGADKSGN